MKLMFDIYKALCQRIMPGLRTTNPTLTHAPNLTYMCENQRLFWKSALRGSNASRPSYNCNQMSSISWDWGHVCVCVCVCVCA